MATPPKHRDAIVDAAVSLFRRQGYAGTGLNDIVKVSGAPKGSLYHYFPNGKAEIAEAAVEEAGRRVTATVAELADKAENAGVLLRAHADLLAGWLAQSGFTDGSPVATVLLELAPADAAVTAAGRAAHGAWRDVLLQRIVADGVPRVRAERLARLCVAAFDGALLQARIEQSGDPLREVSDELAKLLKAAAA